ncbi:MAG: DUF3014 domain-containing protein [Acidobacteria bacterium]|nr:DUF3014 domain-containing protein [Acidobacteriota bacterium]
MAYDDLPLDRPHSPAPSPPPVRGTSSTSRWIITIAALVAVGGGLYFWWITRMPARPAPPAPTTATDVTVGSNRPSRQPLELPALAASDTLIRELVSSLSRHPQLARFLATDQIISAVVLTVEQIGDGRTPVKPLKVLQPAARLGILGTDSGRVDPASYVRWESNVAALTSVRPAEAAQLYVNLKPLFDQAYADLGHPNSDFDASLTRSVKMLLDTPEPTDEPVLMKRASYFEHGDPTLRSLRPVQKQFLLLGADRRARVRAWLTAFSAALDLRLQ